MYRYAITSLQYIKHLRNDINVMFYIIVEWEHFSEEKIIYRQHGQYNLYNGQNGYHQKCLYIQVCCL